MNSAKYTECSFFSDIDLNLSHDFFLKCHNNHLDSKAMAGFQNCGCIFLRILQKTDFKVTLEGKF